MNLIITCARSLESETKNEIKKILDELGDQEPEILNVGMRGILMANTVIEPSKIIAVSYTHLTLPTILLV